MRADEQELRILREEVAQITEKIIELLALRNERSRAIGQLKRRMNVALLDLNAEKDLRERIARVAQRHGLDPESTQRTLTFLFQESLRQQSSIEDREGPRITHMDIFRKAKQLESSGQKVIHLEVGEPDFGAPLEVHRTLSEAAISGYAKYGEAKGLPELRERIIEYLDERFGVRRSPQEVLVVPGGRFGVYAAAAALLSPGDEQLVIDPSWPLYKQAAQLLHARPIAIKTTLEDSWLPRVEDVENSLSSATRLLVLNSPNNPTGAVIDRRLMEEIVEVCRKRSIYVLSDEVYMDYCFTEHYSVLETGYEKSLMLMSFSKSWGMTGYRVGFLVGERAMIDRAASVQAMLMTCVPEFIQRAAFKALEDNETPKVYGRVMKERISEICKWLDSMPVSYMRPRGGMYVFPKIDVKGIDTAEIALKLLEKDRVAIAPGTAFGDYKDHLRISAGTSSEEIAEGLRRLKTYVDSYRRPPLGVKDF
ncbi:MAG: aminotransferase class I/II-fold pyridoxal phosphate-dependent enzyme [Aigarchaeota archaeon]|nr:aminotransferase class I/II-fold pyridoxal phosphate-dependent enzyme [Aigarchaeota archaeon]MDW8092259.1 aminotransferase class I/II-fold pyridoxal phosphate-dependent enzyme [Nitrososphaerota archaeon]